MKISLDVVLGLEFEQFGLGFPREEKAVGFRRAFRMGHSDWERCARVFMGLVVFLSVRISSGYTDLRDVTAVNSLYVALGYPPLPGWVPIGGDPCLDGWQGIQCVNSNITGLILNGANLGGELSGNLDLFTSLIQMDLSNNHIGGSIPSNLPPTIMQLFLSDNQFSGSIPVNLSSFTQLSAVSLNNNHLTGGIPDAFQQLTSLINMDLSSNSLSGQLPPSMGNLLALTTLHLQNNQISGVLDVLQDLPLNELNIENNLFSGPIPAKLLSIPNFRKDGNPFNTTILPPPPTSPPTSPPSSAPAMPPPSLGIANWTASSPETLTPPGSSNFFTNKRIVWISIAGVILLAAIALGLCLLKSRCCGGRQVTYKMTSRDKLGAFATKNPKYKEYLLQSNNQMEKVTTEVVMGPQDGYGTDHRKVGLSSKPQDEQERDGKTINAISRHKKDHKIDMTEWGVNNMPLLPSPPLPPVLPHNSVDEAMVKPSVPAGMAIRSHPLKSLSSQISVSYFSVGLLQQYTNSFSQGNLIGEGTLGSVYRAELPDGKLLAVKKLQPAVSRQLSDDGFLNLVSSISKLQHVNVVKLVGYCAEYGQRLLVHEYCRNGTLNDALHLEDEIHSKLSWSARIRIALGAARALEYLHEVCRPLVVHHNFKSANVLLDDELSVCISDCGLAPLLSSGSANGLTGHLLSAQGYVAPELELGSYTYQSDIYCFGVVMLELLTGRRSYDRSRPRTEQFLVRWAAPQLHDIDALSRMVDPSLKGSYPSKSLSHFADIISLCLQSLCGHTSPVESVTFDSAEVLVAAGASTGVIKLWDLEEAKMVRTLTGHRSNCTAVEFHPFGEFFASGSLDTNLKVWDIRKKGCIHTYKGHTRGISTIRFTPDGRWVVSGGFDNVVKVWDLTAGKLLHDFKFHEGHIRSIDFHPLEFLLATGSADRTVKFWDLETFELIGSARPEATGVRSITFHPDGRTLFCGLDDSLKVYSWEPVVCHDAVDMGWSILGDICIHEGKLLGCSYYRNSVGVWVADISQIEPYGSGLLSKKNGCVERKFDLQESHSVEKVGSSVRSTSGLRSMSPDYDTKEIKNIYVDSSGGNSVASQKVRSFNTPKVLFPSDSQEITNLPTQKHSPGVGLHAKTQGRAITRSFVVPSIVTRDNSDGKDLANSRRESITPARANTGMSLKTSHIRRPSNSKYEAERLLMAVESGSFDSMPNDLDSAMKQNFHSRLVVDDEASESWEEKNSNITSVAEKFEKVLSPQASSNQENSNESLNDNKRINSIKIVNGVAVVAGRTRSLVERFERREKFNSNEDQTTNVSSDMMPERQERFNSNEDQTTKVSSEMMPETARTSPMLKGQPQISGRESTAASEENTIEDVIQNHDLFISTLRSRLTKLQVVRHFWERNDVKGAINALRKLPDHSVQADVVSVLMEKMEILTLDLFSCLLPVLMSLLDSNLERHANLSLDMLLKLVAVFGPVIHSAISAPPAIGVNLQAEHRRECCNQCFIQLQKIQKNLPVIIRRGGLLAKSAQELNLVLQES